MNQVFTSLVHSIAPESESVSEAVASLFEEVSASTATGHSHDVKYIWNAWPFYNITYPNYFILFIMEAFMKSQLYAAFGDEAG